MDKITSIYGDGQLADAERIAEQIEQRRQRRRQRYDAALDAYLDTIYGWDDGSINYKLPDGSWVTIQEYPEVMEAVLKACSKITKAKE